MPIFCQTLNWSQSTRKWAVTLRRSLTSFLSSGGTMHFTFKNLPVVLAEVKLPELWLSSALRLLLVRSDPKQSSNDG